MMTSKSGFAKRLEDEVKKARFSEQQIIEILKLAEAGTKVADLCRNYGISHWTFYQWRNKYGGMGVNEAKRLKELEEENWRLKKIVADQALDLSALKDPMRLQKDYAKQTRVGTPEPTKLRLSLVEK